MMRPEATISTAPARPADPADLPSEHRFASPLGTLRLVASREALLAIFWPQQEAAPSSAVVRLPDSGEAAAHPVLARTMAQLTEYFAGRRQRFDLPLAPVGTPFQRAVWRELAAIPYGETRSYGDLARALAAASGHRTAARAVGAANGRNPLSIVLPCHRVIGSDGSLTGYAGGLATKRWLLDHERTSRGRAVL
jgi:methylated-DNA-[protein]-cysteine S-methyltransferase